MLNICNLVVTGILQIPNIYVLFVFRFLQGVLVGNYMSLIPEFIGELTPKQISSHYSVYPQVSVVLGVLTSYTIGVIYDVTGVNTYENGEVFWRMQFILPALPSLLQFIFMLAGYIP